MSQLFFLLPLIPVFLHSMPFSYFILITLHFHLLKSYFTFFEWKEEWNRRKIEKHFNYFSYLPQWSLLQMSFPHLHASYLNFPVPCLFLLLFINYWLSPFIHVYNFHQFSLLLLSFHLHDFNSKTNLQNEITDKLLKAVGEVMVNEIYELVY